MTRPRESDEWLVIGGANWDLIAAATVDLGPPDSYPGRISESPGGVGRNIAENLARLGLPVSLVSAVGDDRAGDALATHCAELGMDASTLLRMPSSETGRYLSILDRHGALQLAIADMAVLERLTPERLAEFEPRLLRAQGVVLDCNLPGPALEYLLALDRAAPCHVDAVSRTKIRRIAPWLSRIGTLKLNRDEAASLLERELPPVDAARALRDRGVRQVLLSLGRDGVIVADPEAVSHHPAPAVEVVSDAGAGDALFAGLLCGAARGANRDDRIRLARACAAMTLGVHGANHPQLSLQRAASWTAPTRT